MEIANPKFQPGANITAQAERYNSGCPVESKSGSVTEMTYSYYQDGALTGAWLYEVTFADGTSGVFDQCRLEKGLTYGHICNHQGRLAK